MVNLVKALSAPLRGRNVGFETQIIQNTVGCFLDNFRRKQASCYFPLLTNSSHRMRKFS